MQQKYAVFKRQVRHLPCSSWTGLGSLTQSRHCLFSAPSAHCSPFSLRCTQVKEEWVSTEDYLLARYFSFPASKCSDRQKLRVSPPADGVPTTLVWAVNDFPYSLEPGIEHHCVWAPSHEAAAPAALEAFIEVHRPGNTWETLRFVNPAHLRSVRNVWHAHVMSRRRTPVP